MDKRVLSIIGVIAVLVVVAAGAYIWNQSKDGDASDYSSQQTDSPDAGETEGTSGVPEGIPDEPEMSGTYTSPNGTTILINEPAIDSDVDSPLTVSGSVPGSWSSEGQFTVRLVDLKGNVLAEEPATLDGDWMTEEMVPFTVTLTFDQPTEKEGSLVLVKANPSGLPENADSVSIPVKF